MEEEEEQEKGEGGGEGGGVECAHLCPSTPPNMAMLCSVFTFHTLQHFTCWYKKGKRGEEKKEKKRRGRGRMKRRRRRRGMT